MWSTPSSIARRRTARAASGSRGGPNTPGPASCMAPKPIRRTGLSPRRDVCAVVMDTDCASVAPATRSQLIMGVAPPPTRREELAEFLRHLRERTAPDAVGLNGASGRRRTPGLRREEVSQLAGVGLSWYTWLEQGREITPSPSVLDALAVVFDLSGAERAHLFDLAGVAVPAPADPYPTEAPAELATCVSALDPIPAFLTNPRADVLASARAAAAVISVASLGPDGTRNMLRALFTESAPGGAVTPSREQ